MSFEFRLHYEGNLKSNGTPSHKQDIRRNFHPQLKKLWQQNPLKNFIHYTESSDDDSMIIKVENFNFVPLCCSNHYLKLIAKLNIILLRPEEPGSIITQAGDIDNRLKTLLDALRIPQSEQEIPYNDKPSGDEDPFYCLLEDDNLITSISITTDRLLTPTADSSYVYILLHVILDPIHANLSTFEVT